MANVVVYGIIKLSNTAVMNNGNYNLIIPQASLIIIVFNIETYLKYLLFEKLHKLMDSNIFVILS